MLAPESLAIIRLPQHPPLSRSSCLRVEKVCNKSEFATPTAARMAADPGGMDAAVQAGGTGEQAGTEGRLRSYRPYLRSTAAGPQSPEFDRLQVRRVRLTGPQSPSVSVSQVPRVRTRPSLLSGFSRTAPHGLPYPRRCDVRGGLARSTRAAGLRSGP